MYALLNLNPFTITGANYSHLNQEGDLDSTNYSDQYLEDRAKFLYYLAHPDATVSNFDPDIDFVDNRLGISRTVDNGMMSFQDDSQYLFGNLKGELLEGEDESDHLYGMSGDDIIQGNAGNDYIEGGKGQDTMDGGAGNDIFHIQEEDEDYDIFIGGAGDDTIKGSDDSSIKDVIRVHTFDSSNSIEKIDGKGGENIIAGTDDADTIDLSGTQLVDINRIEGGGGKDTITGSIGSDHLYGGSLDQAEDFAQDTLEGGAGADTYHVGYGDTIIDTDKTGVIWSNGKKLTSLTLQQVYKDKDYYQNSDKSYSASYDKATGSLTVTTADNPGAFTIKNYSSGNFGITLQDYSPPANDPTYHLSGTDYRNEMGILFSGPQPEDWHLQYTSFPTSDPQEPFWDEMLVADPPSLDITGGLEGDLLFGFQASDQIAGGEGGDIIIGALLTYDGQTLYTNSSFDGDFLSGDGGNDWITGSGGDDIIDGGDGNDLISGLDGQDTLLGGLGNDLIAGGKHDTQLYGGDGDDILLAAGYFYSSSGGTITLDNLAQYSATLSYYSSGGQQLFPLSYTSQNFYTADVTEDPGNNTLYGGAGNDLMRGGGGEDVLYGEEDHDSLSGGGGADSLYGGSGQDNLIGDNGDMVETTKDGDDFLFGGQGDDFLFGLGGADTLYGEEGDDQLSGGSGDDSDTLVGEAGNDTLNGGEGADYLYGDNGDATGSGADHLFGNAGNDHLYGHGGNDVLFGGEGNDELQGNAGADELYGGSGDDDLFGQEGNDILQGGTGSDYLEGGGGTNTYIFTPGDSGGAGDTVKCGEGQNIIQLDGVELASIGLEMGRTGNGTDLFLQRDRITL